MHNKIEYTDIYKNKFHQLGLIHRTVLLIWIILYPAIKYEINIFIAQRSTKSVQNYLALLTNTHYQNSLNSKGLSVKRKIVKRACRHIRYI